MQQNPRFATSERLTILYAGIQDKCWTKDINDKNDYKEIIDVIRKKTGSKSLAQWELGNWERRNY